MPEIHSIRVRVLLMLGLVALSVPACIFISYAPHIQLVQLQGEELWAYEHILSEVRLLESDRPLPKHSWVRFDVVNNKVLTLASSSERLSGMQGFAGRGGSFFAIDLSELELSADKHYYMLGLTNTIETEYLEDVTPLVQIHLDPRRRLIHNYFTRFWMLYVLLAVTGLAITFIIRRRRSLLLTAISLLGIMVVTSCSPAPYIGHTSLNDTTINANVSMVSQAQLLECNEPLESLNTDYYKDWNIPGRVISTTSDKLRPAMAPITTWQHRSWHSFAFDLHGIPVDSAKYYYVTGFWGPNGEYAVNIINVTPLVRVYLDPGKLFVHNYFTRFWMLYALLIVVMTLAIIRRVKKRRIKTSTDENAH